jgi:hypothetical protein
MAEEKDCTMMANLPAPALSDLAKLPDLIFDRLLVGRYADVDCSTTLALLERQRLSEALLRLQQTLIMRCGR